MGADSTELSVLLDQHSHSEIRKENLVFSRSPHIPDPSVHFKMYHFRETFIGKEANDFVKAV